MAQQNQQNQQNQTRPQTSQPMRESSTSTEKRGFGASNNLESDIQADGVRDGSDISGRPVEVNGAKNAAASRPSTSTKPSTQSLSDEDVDADEEDLSYGNASTRPSKTSERDNSARI